MIATADNLQHWWSMTNSRGESPDLDGNRSLQLMAYSERVLTEAQESFQRAKKHLEEAEGVAKVAREDVEHWYFSRGDSVKGEA